MGLSWNIWWVKLFLIKLSLTFTTISLSQIKNFLSAKLIDVSCIQELQRQLTHCLWGVFFLGEKIGHSWIQEKIHLIRQNILSVLRFKSVIRLWSRGITLIVRLSTSLMERFIYLLILRWKCKHQLDLGRNGEQKMHVNESRHTQRQVGHI